MPSTTPPLMGGPVAEVNSEDPVPSERQDLIAGTDPNGAYSHPSIPCFLGSSAEFSNILSVPGETRASREMPERPQAVVCKPPVSSLQSVGRLEAGDREGIQRLMQYFLRCPFIQARMIQVTCLRRGFGRQAGEGQVIPRLRDGRQSTRAISRGRQR